MSLLREHLLCPGILVADTEWVITIIHSGKVIGEYGCYFGSREEIEDGILFRASRLLGVSMMDSELVNCEGVVEGAEGFCVFSYIPEEFQFLEI